MRPLGTVKLAPPPPLLAPDADRASPRLVAVVEVVESGMATPEPLPEPEDAVVPSTTGAEGPASEAASAVLLLPFEVVFGAALSELVFAWRAARRLPSAAAAWPSD